MKIMYGGQELSLPEPATATIQFNNIDEASEAFRVLKRNVSRTAYVLGYFKLYAAGYYIENHRGRKKLVPIRRK